MGLRVEDVSTVCQKKKGNILGQSIDMPHRPVDSNYETFDKWLKDQRSKSEVLKVKDWSDNQISHISDFFQESRFEVKKKTRTEAIQELEAKPKLTARQRKALKNLRIKQRREARKMKRVEKRLRSKRGK